MLTAVRAGGGKNVLKESSVLVAAAGRNARCAGGIPQRFRNLSLLFEQADTR